MGVGTRSTKPTKNAKAAKNQAASPQKWEQAQQVSN